MKSLKTKRPYFYILPALLFISLFIGYGIFRAGVESLGSNGSMFVHYTALLSSEEVYKTVRISLYVTVTSTLLSILIGLGITRLLYRFFTSVKWKYIVWVPIIIPHFVAAYLVFILFSQSGLLSTVLHGVNGFGLPFPLVNDQGYIGVILTYIWKEVPFVVLMLLPIYQQIDQRFEDVVRTLGGNTWQVWKTVELPWVGPVLLETGLIIFAFVIAAYEVPALLGVTYPKMFSVLVYEWFYEGSWENRPLAQALMIVLTVVMVISSLIIITISKRWKKQWAKEKIK
ncbi:ABC transporter permease [Salinicoccus albus]|uniref:ABC transporter permease n=1 Tax=Salinicoccus albus TaxID=418756 RepID=UPI0003625F75|nr:ABC transporter permease subunit [Salinicoccus albus]